MAGPSLGINLGGVVDWTTAYPFLDLFRTSRDWFTSFDPLTDRADGLDLDATGWVRGLTRDGSAPDFSAVQTIMATGAIPPRAGVYVLDWQGTADITIFHGATILAQGDQRMVLQLDPTMSLALGLSNIDPLGTGDYARDIRLYHQDDTALIAAGQQFTPEFLERIDDFRVLRFMDWGRTNNSDVVTRDDLTPLAAARETLDSGVSLATMVNLANQVRSDPWFCIPHGATDAAIRAIAVYVRDHLDAGLVARFEYSNEVWNWGFQQAQWAQAQAEAAWGADVEGGWMQWYGARAANMARIVADVFGDDTGTRALNVFCTQGAWQGLETYALDAPDHVAGGGTAPRDAPFHVYAIAPYFGGEMGSAAMSAQVDLWIGQGAAGFDAAIEWLRTGDAQDSLANLGAMIRYHAARAADLGWQLEAYEAGQHIVDQDGLFGGGQDVAQTDFFTALVRKPAFFQLYLDYFDTWRDAGGGLMATFSDFGPPGRFGSWGIWDSIWSGETPRSRAVTAFNATVTSWWDDDRDAATFANGDLRADYADTGRLTGGRQGDMLFGLGGMDGILGRDGADHLYGGRGADQMSGGQGHDTITGGRGADDLTGGRGADRFVFARGDGADRIMDFRPGQDRLDLVAGTVPTRWHAADHVHETADGVLLRLGQGDRILFAGLMDVDALAGAVGLL